MNALNYHKIINRMWSYIRVFDKPSEAIMKGRSKYDIAKRHVWAVEEKRKSDEEFYDLKHLIQLRDDLNVLIDGYNDFSFYQVSLHHCLSAGSSDIENWHPYPLVYSAENVCISFYYGINYGLENSRIIMPNSFLENLYSDEAEYFISDFEQSKSIAFFKDKTQKIGFIEARDDYTWLMINALRSKDNE